MKESNDQFFATWVAVIFGKAEIILFNLLVDADWVIRIASIREDSADHFKEDDAERPDVHRKRVSFGLDDLRGHVMRGS